MIIYKFLIFAIILNTNVFASNTYMEAFFYALEIVESGGDDEIIGDKGKAIGRFQIWESYYRDARNFDKSLKNTTYRDVQNPIIARKVVLAYFARYEREALKNLNFETLARLHHSGPNWREKALAGNLYWKKVKKEMR